jgi:hypothetical protein
MSDHGVKGVHAWLVTQPKLFFFCGHTEAVTCCIECVEKAGDYV